MKRSFWAILSTLCFSLSTPATKILVATFPPVTLAAILYGGSVLGVLLGLVPGLRMGPSRVGEFWRFASLSGTARLALAGSILLGGMIAPVLLIFGLARAPASQGSLLMNSEGIFTVLLAWGCFGERMSGRLFFGTILGGAGCALLSGSVEGGGSLWALPFLGASLLWAFDSNLLKFLGEINPLVLVVWKGAGSSLLLLLVASRTESFPPLSGRILEALAVGGIGYGVSLVFFIRSIRMIGVSRTGAWFSFSPFLGAFFSLVLLHETPSPMFLVSFGILAVAAFLLQDPPP